MERFTVTRGAEDGFDLALEVVAEDRTYELEFAGGRDPEGLTDLLDATSLWVERAEGELEFGSISLEYHANEAFGSMSFDRWSMRA